MGRRWEERTDEFDVEDEAGNIYHVVQHTEFERVSSAQAVSLGNTCKTTDGNHVNRLSEDEFEILALEGSIKAKRV